MIPKLLIIDDDKVDRLSIKRLLGQEFEYIEAATGGDGLALCESERPDCVLLDFRLPDRDGLEVLDALAERNLAVIMLSGQGDEKVAVAALKRGASDYLIKGRLKRDVLARAIHGARLHKTVLAQRRTLHSNEGRIVRVLESIPAAVFVVTADGAPYYANKCATEILGKGIVPGMSPSDLSSVYQVYVAGTDEFYPTEKLPLVRALAGEVTTVTDMEVQRERRLRINSTASPIYDENGNIEYAVVVFRDVTEQHELEVQFRQAQKMEAVGLLAGGVAHDFNNLLTAILSFGRFVLKDLEEGTQAYSDQQEVLKAANRARELTGQLLAFSRKQPVKPVVTTLNSVLENTHKMLERILGDDVDVRLELDNQSEDEAAWSVLLDPGVFEQVLMNLAVNARDAMPNGGTLTFEVQRAHLTELTAKERDAEVAPGDYVVLVASDTGHGMDAETKRRLFEPFFTTKELNRGTGLGLATCYGIVKQAGGFIWVYSELGHGTTFKVYLPRVEVTPMVRSQAPSSARLRGTETVLVVEDDPAVREVAVRSLKDHGYGVLAASSGVEAYDLLQKRQEPVDLLLSDVIMPQMSGRQLADRAHRRWPQMKVLFMSGYTRSAIAQHGVLAEDVELIQKPFQPDGLAAEVRRVLDTAGPPVIPRKYRVLFVGQGQDAKKEISKLISGECEVDFASKGSTGLDLIRNRDFDVIIADASLPDLGAVDLFHRVSAYDESVARRFVFVVGALSAGPTQTFLDHASQPVIRRPLDEQRLLGAVRVILEQEGGSQSRLKVLMASSAE